MRLPRGPVTNALVALNVAIAAVLLVPIWWQHALIAGALFPARFGAGANAFADAGVLVPAILTPISAAFLHGGIAHVVLNMLMLLLIGKMVERVTGGVLYLLLYFTGAYAAAIMECAAAFLGWPMSAGVMTPIIGASGALSAIIGAYVMLFPNKQPKDWGPIPASIARPLHLLAAWAALNLALGFVAPDWGMGIAIWSHIGGFIAGLLLARPLLRWRYRKA